MPGTHAMLLYDGAGWHQTGNRLHVPENISLLPMPPYAADLNPMENVWAYLRKQQALASMIWNSYNTIISACKETSSFLISDPKHIKSMGKRKWTCLSIYAGRSV